MTTYITIANASVAVGAIPSSSLMTAMRDNPIAIAEGSSGAPVVSTGWHPVDKVTVGDGKTGIIYDHAVNGTVANVITPDFEDGYEYRVVARDLSHNDPFNSRRLYVYGYFETTSTYRLMLLSNDGGSSNNFGCDVEFLLPRIPSSAHMLRATTYNNSAIRNSTDQESGSYTGGSGKLLRALLSFSGGSIDGGKVWLLRRREYATTG